MRFRVAIGVLAGSFADQRLAFAHLLDICAEADLDQVDVLAPPSEARLRGYFDAATSARLMEEGEALVLLLPGSGVPLRSTDRLRVVGTFRGRVTRALLG